MGDQLMTKELKTPATNPVDSADDEEKTIAALVQASVLMYVNKQIAKAKLNASVMSSRKSLCFGMLYSSI